MLFPFSLPFFPCLLCPHYRKSWQNLTKLHEVLSEHKKILVGDFLKIILICIRYQIKIFNTLWNSTLKNRYHNFDIWDLNGFNTKITRFPLNLEWKQPFRGHLEFKLPWYLENNSPSIIFYKKSIPWTPIKGKNEGSRPWGDWQAYFHRSLGISRSEGIYWSLDTNRAFFDVF